MSNEIRIWISDGCDPELDIIGTIEDVMTRRNAQGAELPGSFAYFTKSVSRAKANRLAGREPEIADQSGGGGFGAPGTGWSQAKWCQ